MSDLLAARRPTREEVLDLCASAGRHLRKADRARVIAAVGKLDRIVYGDDEYAGGCCPLRAAGFERDRTFYPTYGPWRVKGGSLFTDEFDRGMQRITGLTGPALLGFAAAGQLRRDEDARS